MKWKWKFELQLHALTATADVPAVYLQQFWRTVSKVPDTEDTIKFLLDTEQFIYTVDIVGYQGVVDKVSAFYTNNLAQRWQTMFKVFNRCLTTRTSGHDQTKINILQLFHVLIIADLMKKFPDILKRLEEDYHSIKDDVPLIKETDDFKEYETVFMKSKKRKQIARESSSLRKSLKITINQKQLVEKDNDDSKDRIEPRSHKDNPEVVVDDDDKESEKQDDEMGSLEVRNEETQTTIPTPLSSPRKILSSDKKTFQELTDIVSNPTISTSKLPQVKKRISSKYSHLPGALRRMCRRQVIPQIAENVTNDLIEANLKPCIVNTIIEDRDAFRSEVPAFVSQEFKTHARKIITKLFEYFVQSNVIYVHPTTSSSNPTDSSANLQYQLYLKMKRNLQDQADNITLWEALRHKFENSSTSNTSCREDDFHSYHDEHQDDDAPPEGEKILKSSKNQHQEWDAWEEENFVDEDEVIPEDVTPELIAESQNVNKRVPTIFDHARIEATFDNQSIERDRLIGIGFVLDFVEFISFTFGDKEMISVIEAVSR
ncbi:hypothetical protein Tco_1315753 [Tanacetum coccineum]